MGGLDGRTPASRNEHVRAGVVDMDGGLYCAPRVGPAPAPPLRSDPNCVADDWSVALALERDSFAAWPGAWVTGEELFLPGIASRMRS
jgi:hypothetical protein